MGKRQQVVALQHHGCPQGCPPLSQGQWWREMLPVWELSNMFLQDRVNGLARDLEEHCWKFDGKELSNQSQRWRHLCPLWTLMKEWSQRSVILVIWSTRWPILCKSLRSYTNQPWQHGCRYFLDVAAWTSTHQDQSGYRHCWLPSLPPNSRDQPRAPNVAPLSGVVE